MPRTPAEQDAWDFQVMGCTKADLLQSIPPIVGPLLYAMEIWSDAQEVVYANGSTEVIRHLINRAMCIMADEIKRGRK